MHNILVSRRRLRNYRGVKLYRVINKGNIDTPKTAFKKDSGIDNTTYSTKVFKTKAVSEVVLPPNPDRKYLLIQNRSAQVIYMGLDDKATTESIIIAIGGSFEPEIPPTNEINIAGTVVDQNVLIVEG